MKSSWLIGYVLNRCGVPCAYEIGMMLAKETDEPVVPDVPESSLYLYGTPSTTGNIGLRSGESVTYYDGVVLPALPEYDKSKYPYAYVCSIWTNMKYHLFVCDKPAMIAKDGSDDGWNWFISSCNTDINMLFYSCEPDVYGRWSPEQKYSDWSLNTMYNGKLPPTQVYQPIWASEDMEIYTYPESGNYVFTPTGEIGVYGSEAVPVHTGIVGYSYSGTVLPAPPEWDKTTYPHAVITRNDTTSGVEYVFAAFTKTVCINQARNFVAQDSSAFGRTYWDYDAEKNEWVFHYANAESDSTYFKAQDGVVWTNTDLYNYAYNTVDTLNLAATDPITIYE